MYKAIDQIFDRPQGQQIWMVRADSGMFLEHFISNNVAAIGHADSLFRDLPDEPQIISSLSEGELERAIRSQYELDGRSPPQRAAMRNVIAQARAFIEGITTRDLVLSLDNEYVHIGRVQSPAYISGTALSNRFRYNERAPEKKLTFAIRRNVDWFARLKRADLPARLQLTLFAQQTVASLTNHAHTIYHLIFPIFIDQESLHFTAQLKTTESVSSQNLSAIFRIFSEAEFLLKSNDPISLIVSGNFDAEYRRFLRRRETDLSWKADFMSPGDLLGTISHFVKRRQNIAIFLLVYGAIFGIDLHIVKMDGIIDAKSRQMIIEFILQRMSDIDAEQAAKELELQPPSGSQRPYPRSKEDGSTNLIELADLES